MVFIRLNALSGFNEIRLPEGFITSTINKMIATGNVEINKNRNKTPVAKGTKKTQINLIRHFDYKCGNFCLLAYFSAICFHEF